MGSFGFESETFVPVTDSFYLSIHNTNPSWQAIS